MSISFYERDITRVSLIFLPVDQFVGGLSIKDEVQVYLDGVYVPPLHNPEGYILYMDLPSQTYTVRAEARYYDLYVDIVADSATFDPLTDVIQVPMEPKPDYPFPDNASLLRGTIKDQAGNPVAGARVDVVGDTRFVLTDAKGECVLYFDPVDPTMNVSLNISCEGYQTQSINTTVVQYDTVSFNSSIVYLDGPDVALITGRVSDSSQKPVTQAKVEIDGTSISTLSDARGEFVLAKQLSLPTEEAIVNISQDGYADASYPVSLAQQSSTGVYAMLTTMPTPEMATLEVTVRDRSGNPIGDALVEVIEKNRFTYTGYQDAAVVYYFETLVGDSESVTIRITRDGYRDKVVEDLLRVSKTSRVRVALYEL